MAPTGLADRYERLIRSTRAPSPPETYPRRTATWHYETETPTTGDSASPTIPPEPLADTVKPLLIPVRRTGERRITYAPQELIDQDDRLTILDLDREAVETSSNTNTPSRPGSVAPPAGSEKRDVIVQGSKIWVPRADAPEMSGIPRPPPVRPRPGEGGRLKPPTSSSKPAAGSVKVPVGERLAERGRNTCREREAGSGRAHPMRTRSQTRSRGGAESEPEQNTKNRARRRSKSISLGQGRALGDDWDRPDGQGGVNFGKLHGNLESNSKKDKSFRMPIVRPVDGSSRYQGEGFETRSSLHSRQRLERLFDVEYSLPASNYYRGQYQKMSSSPGDGRDTTRVGDGHQKLGPWRRRDYERQGQERVSRDDANRDLHQGRAVLQVRSRDTMDHRGEGEMHFARRIDGDAGRGSSQERGRRPDGWGQEQSVARDGKSIRQGRSMTRGDGVGEASSVGSFSTDPRRNSAVIRPGTIGPNMGENVSGASGKITDRPFSGGPSASSSASPFPSPNTVKERSRAKEVTDGSTTLLACPLCPAGIGWPPRSLSVHLGSKHKGCNLRVDYRTMTVCEGAAPRRNPGRPQMDAPALAAAGPLPPLAWWSAPAAGPGKDARPRSAPAADPNLVMPQHLRWAVPRGIKGVSPAYFISADSASLYDSEESIEDYPDRRYDLQETDWAAPISAEYYDSPTPSYHSDQHRGRLAWESTNRKRALSEVSATQPEFGTDTRGSQKVKLDSHTRALLDRTSEALTQASTSIPFSSTLTNKATVTQHETGEHQTTASQTAPIQQNEGFRATSVLSDQPDGGSTNGVSDEAAPSRKTLSSPPTYPFAFVPAFIANNHSHNSLTCVLERDASVIPGSGNEFSIDEVRYKAAPHKESIEASETNLPEDGPFNPHGHKKVDIMAIQHVLDDTSFPAAVASEEAFVGTSAIPASKPIKQTDKNTQKLMEALLRLKSAPLALRLEVLKRIKLLQSKRATQPAQPSKTVSSDAEFVVADAPIPTAGPIPQIRPVNLVGQRLEKSPAQNQEPEPSLVPEQLAPQIHANLIGKLLEKSTAKSQEPEPSLVPEQLAPQIHEGVTQITASVGPEDESRNGNPATNCSQTQSNIPENTLDKPEQALASLATLTGAVDPTLDYARPTEQVNPVQDELTQHKVQQISELDAQKKNDSSTLAIEWIEGFIQDRSLAEPNGPNSSSQSANAHSDNDSIGDLFPDMRSPSPIDAAAVREDKGKQPMHNTREPMVFRIPDRPLSKTPMRGGSNRMTPKATSRPRDRSQSLVNDFPLHQAPQPVAAPVQKPKVYRRSQRPAGTPFILFIAKEYTTAIFGGAEEGVGAIEILQTWYARHPLGILMHPEFSPPKKVNEDDDGLLEVVREVARKIGRWCVRMKLRDGGKEWDAIVVRAVEKKMEEEMWVWSDEE
ncbi:hypothetical protein DFH27DRAFT_604257 [Peziza echinospora]|nr:hypothetical protein DFH27DRAFT_604257 [Peziza echinospora]